MSGSFVRVPPDSTGKKIATRNSTEIFFDNKVGDINVGNIITGAITGATGTVTDVATGGFVVNAGAIFLEEVTGSFQNNENLQISAVTVADTDFSGGKTQQEFEMQKMLIVDPNNPSHIQTIDRFGATLNTFTGGAPTFSPFGEMNTGEKQLIRGYRFAVDDLPNEFYNKLIGNGTAAYESSSGSSLLTTTTTSGDVARRTTHFYHPYAPGVGHSAIITARIGDQGKANVRRRWGYFDDNNGVFFELDGTTFSVVVRSNVTGSVVDTKIEQDKFNHDGLDGSDSINFDIDLSKPNIYYIDLQWLGSGRVKFAVSEPQGELLTAHLVEHANVSEIYPYMKTASLPFRFEQENTGVSASTSEMRVACASINHSTKVKIVGNQHTFSTPFASQANTDGEQIMLSLRPKLLFKTAVNHNIIRFTSSFYNNITVAGTALAVIYRIYFSASALLGGTPDWISLGDNSITERDIAGTAGTALSSGQALSSAIVGPNSAIEQLADTDRSLHHQELYLDADETTQRCVIITAEVVGGTGSVITGVSANWEEIKL